MKRRARASSRVALAGSEKAAFAEGSLVGPAPRAGPVSVTVRLRRRTPLASPVGNAQFRVVDYERFRALHGADPADVAKVESFAAAQGLIVTRVSLAQRAVDLAGTVAQMERAFGTRLSHCRVGRHAFRTRRGGLTIPAALAGVIEGVFGLDDRPLLRPHIRFAKRSAGKVSPRAGAAAFTPIEVAALYDFPPGSDGRGETIAILEFGGGFRAADLARYFHDLGIAAPRVAAVSVGGARNAPTGKPEGADGEVMLDIEVAGAVAPGAAIFVYFAPNSDEGFLNALYAAIHDNLRRPSIVSISWGAPETASTRQTLRDYDAACIDAAALGITICASAGDHGSADTDPPDARARVDFPAASPHVLACGGTRLVASGNSIASETVWNNRDGWATGGGVSEVFARPDYQKIAGVPRSANARGKTGRGVPDVAGNGDGETGYRIRVDGVATVVGGTSAVAPLWAGLIARLNQQSGARLGFLHPRLYALPRDGGLRDITEGDNGAYAAKPGWDACTGLGSPDGAALARNLRASRVRRKGTRARRAR